MEIKLNLCQSHEEMLGETIKSVIIDDEHVFMTFESGKQALCVLNDVGYNEFITTIPSTSLLNAREWGDSWVYELEICEVNIAEGLIKVGIITEEMLEEARNRRSAYINSKKKDFENAEREMYEKLKKKYETDK